MKQLPLTGFCSINMGQSPDSKSYNSDQKGLPFFQGNADFGPVCPNVRVWCSEPIKIAEPGDILISVRAPIGAMNMANTRCCIGRGLASLTPNGEKCVPQYLYYALQSRVDFLISQGTGSTFKAISKKVLSDALIPDYPLDEQRKIAAVLDKIDSLTAKRRRQLEKLDELVKSRFVEMFDDADLPQLPLQDCCSNITGGSTPSMRHPEYYGGDVPFIKSGDVRGDSVSSGALWLTEAALKETTAKYVPANSVLVVNRSAALLREFRAALSANPVVINQDIKAFVPKPEFTAEYLLWAIKIQSQYLLTKVTTVLTSHIDLSDLCKLGIPVADKQSQNSFSHFKKQADQTKLSVRRSLDALETLKKSLMQNWFA